MDQMLVVMPPGDKPAFLRLANGVVAEIERGRLRPGDRLPGSRPLARTLGVHRNTVLAAWRELRAQGWIEATPGGATRVAPLPDRVRRPRRSTRPAAPFAVEPPPPILLGPRWPPGVLGLAGGRPDLRELPAADIARAWRAAVRSTRGRVLDYGDPRGYPRLRTALADWLAAERGLAVKSDDLVVTRGSQQALFLVTLALIRPGDRVGVEALGYPPAWSALRATGGTLVALPLDGGGVRTEPIAEVARKGLRAAYVTPHHQFPTLATLSAPRRLELLAHARAFGFATIEDDYDHEFHYDGKPVLPLAAHDPAVISIATLSKTLAPGLRLGWMAGPKAVVDSVAAHRIAVDRQGDAATELAVAMLIEDGTVGRHLRRMRRIYASRRDALVHALRARLGDRIRFEVPAGGLALWVEADLDVEQWARDSLEEGVGFETGRRFLLEGGHTRHVRLGFASLGERELERAIGVLQRTANRQR